ncbi:hypothetical protein GPECTOR_56g401 [Gonium pectorale]|uniref:Ankyrin repeat domain-containing protein n=1 Tax=Gonium pectorale TaxID=33097 RepID=A0A150G6Z2_GONPE|nr:hypothetical protein GPECTOR_56g401 [Gonium pectorale]|eukprot:KXZ45305.1 hypothetical protein GPECTOR_56g401 [Gonium pectorale]
MAAPIGNPDATTSARIWIPSIIDRIAHILHRNEVACSLRVVDTSTAAMLRTPEFTTVRLSEPVPHHSFAWRWGRPGMMRDWTRAQREKLLCLTAASGATANLALAARVAGCRPTPEVGYAAGKAGHLGSCALLAELGCEMVHAIEGAAAGGHLSLCEELTGWAAAEKGHLHVLQALHAAGRSVGARGAAYDAARNGHLHVLAWLVETPGLGVVLDEELFRAAAAWGSVELLAWLRERGCRWGGRAFSAAAESGCKAALEWLAERGCPMDYSAFALAVRVDDIAMLECLQRLGCPWGPTGFVFDVCFQAGHTNQVRMLSWLLAAGCPIDWPKAVKKAEADMTWAADWAAKEPASRHNADLLEATALRGEPRQEKKQASWADDGSRR